MKVIPDRDEAEGQTGHVLVRIKLAGAAPQSSKPVLVGAAPPTGTSLLPPFFKQPIWLPQAIACLQPLFVMVRTELLLGLSTTMMMK